MRQKEDRRSVNPGLTRSLDPAKSLDQVGAACGFTRERARQVEESGLSRMRSCLNLIESGMRTDHAIRLCAGKGSRAELEEMKEYLATLEAALSDG